MSITSVSAVVCSFDFKSFFLSVLIWLHPAFYALFAFFCLFIFLQFLLFVWFGICFFDFVYLSLFSFLCVLVFIYFPRWILYLFVCLLFFCYVSAPVFLLHPAFHLWLPSTCRSLRLQHQPSYCSTREDQISKLMFDIWSSIRQDQPNYLSTR